MRIRAVVHADTHDSNSSILARIFLTASGVPGFTLGKPGSDLRKLIMIIMTA